MDALARYVNEKNIANFVACLRVEFDPGRRKLLARLLSLEVFRFGSGQERLKLIEQNLVDAATRIAHQKHMIEAAMTSGADPGRAETELRNLAAIQEIFLSLRERLLHDPQAGNDEIDET